MTKRTKRILLIGCVAALVYLSVIVLQRIGKTELDDFYSPAQYSDSIATARETGRLVSIPKLETPEIQLGDLRFPVKDVWIEKQTQVNHRWFRDREENYHWVSAYSDANRFISSGNKDFPRKNCCATPP
jgi:hypothetical protein